MSRRRISRFTSSYCAHFSVFEDEHYGMGLIEPVDTDPESRLSVAGKFHPLLLESNCIENNRPVGPSESPSTNLDFESYPSFSTVGA